MAAIIAQMAAANRERKKRILLRDTMPCNKSNVTLLPFHPHSFDPKINNRHIAQSIEKQERKVLKKVAMRNILKKERDEYRRHEHRRRYQRLADLVTRQLGKDGVERLLQMEDEREILDELESMERHLDEEDSRISRVAECLKIFVAATCLLLFATILVYINIIMFFAE